MLKPCKLFIIRFYINIFPPVALSSRQSNTLYLHLSNSLIVSGEHRLSGTSARTSALVPESAAQERS